MHGAKPFACLLHALSDTLAGPHVSNNFVTCKRFHPDKQKNLYAHFAAYKSRSIDALRHLAG